MGQSGKKILLVDDSAFQLARIKELLSESNHEILECISAPDAMEVLEKYKGELDLVITDLEMPGMSGFEFLKWLKDRPYSANISTLVLTGAYDLTAVVNSMKDLGVNGVLEKGGHPHHILSRVNAILFPEIVEKRNYDRVSVRVPVDFEINGQHYDAEVTNLSLGGCFLLTDKLSKADEQLALLMTLPGQDRKLKIIGTVVWVVGGEDWQSKKRTIEGMGLKWHHLSDDNRLELEVYIEECLKVERLYSLLSP